MPTDIYIVLLGDPGAGKSYYLFALGLALQQHPKLRRRWTVLNLSESYEQQIEKWKQQHSEKRKIDATPLNSSLQFHFELKDKQSEEIYRIQLADMAGAEGLSCRNIAEIFPQLAEAKSAKGGVLFLVDSQNLRQENKPEQYQQCAEWLEKLFKFDIFQSFGICLTQADTHAAVLQFTSVFEELQNNLNKEYSNKYQPIFDIKSDLGDEVKKEWRDNLKTWRDYLEDSINGEIKSERHFPFFDKIFSLVSQQEVKAKYHYVSALGLCKDKQHPVPKQPFNVFGPILDVVEDIARLSEKVDKNSLIAKLQEIIFTKEQELESLKQELSDKTETLQLAEEIEELKQIVQKKEEDINQLKQQLADEKQSIIGLDEQLKDKQSELEQSRTAFEKLHIDYSLYPQQIEQQSQKIEELEEELGKRDERGIFERIFIWLSGCDPKTLATCSKQEQVAQIRLGMSVLIPTLFGFVAALLYLSGHNIPPLLSILLAFMWATAVLLIDVSVLATSRIHLGNSWGYYFKFLSRIMLAILVGFVVSHPLSLKLFGETIETQMNKMKNDEKSQIIDSNDAEKLGVLKKQLAQNANDSFKGIKKLFSEVHNEKEQMANSSTPDIEMSVSAIESELSSYQNRIKKIIESDCTSTNIAQSQIEQDSTLQQFKNDLVQLEKERDTCKKNQSQLVNARKAEMGGTREEFPLDNIDCKFPMPVDFLNTSTKSQKGTCDFAFNQVTTSGVSERGQKCMGKCCSKIKDIENNLKQYIGGLDSKITDAENAITQRKGDLQGQSLEGGDEEIAKCSARYGSIQQGIDKLLGLIAKNKERQTEIEVNIKTVQDSIDNKNDELFKTKALATFLFDSLSSEEEGKSWEGKILLTLYLAVALVILTLDTMPIIMKFLYYGEYDKKVQFDAESYVGVYSGEYKKERTDLLKDAQHEKEKSKVEAEKFRIRQERIKLFQDEMDRMDAELLKKEHNKRLIIAGIREVFSKKLKEEELNKELESLRDMKSKMQDDVVKNF